MIHDPGYLSRMDELRWFPWSIDAIRLLNRAGFLVFVLTNQGGVGLGLFDEHFVHDVHRAMDERLRQGGARVDDWFYCPHHPRAVVESLRVECRCRKPRPGMIEQAEQQYAIDRARSYVVGDKMSDVGLAAATGATGILVRTGHGELAVAGLERKRAAASGDERPQVAANLMDATAWILARRGHHLEAS